MGLAALTDVMYYPPVSGRWGSTTNFQIDAANEKAAFVFRAPKTGTIDRVCFRTATVTTGETVDVRLETVGTDGNPTGTLWGTNTNASKVVNSSDDNVWIEVTLTAGASVTRGQAVALVVAMPGVTSGNIQIVRTLQDTWNTTIYSDGMSGAYGLIYTGSWGRAPGANIAVRYDDGSYPFLQGNTPATSSGAGASFGSTSSPDERGIRFTLPFHATCVGLWCSVTAGSTTFDLKLYDNSSSLLESANIDADIGGTGVPIFIGMFDTDVELAASTVYRATVAPDTATAVVLRGTTVDSSSLMTAMPGGGNAYLTTRTDGGSWTDTNTGLPQMGLIISALDDGAGGAAGGGASRRVWGRGGQH